MVTINTDVFHSAGIHESLNTFGKFNASLLPN